MATPSALIAATADQNSSVDADQRSRSLVACEPLNLSPMTLPPIRTIVALFFSRPSTRRRNAAISSALYLRTGALERCSEGVFGKVHPEAPFFHHRRCPLVRESLLELIAGFGEVAGPPRAAISQVLHQADELFPI